MERAATRFERALSKAVVTLAAWGVAQAMAYNAVSVGLAALGY